MIIKWVLPLPEVTIKPSQELVFWSRPSGLSVMGEEVTSRASAGNTKAGSITVPLTSSLTGFESAV